MSFVQAPCLTYVISHVWVESFLGTMHAQGTPTLPYMKTFVSSFAPSILPARFRLSWSVMEVCVLSLNAPSLAISLPHVTNQSIPLFCLQNYMFLLNSFLFFILFYLNFNPTNHHIENYWNCLLFLIFDFPHSKRTIEVEPLHIFKIFFF
jgi:hypothetical protein